MKTWDVIVIGAGIIGLSLVIELRKTGRSVLIVEKGAPGREASWAAGGMLADFLLETPPPLQELATASARMYPEFVHQLEDESGLKIDLRDQGTLLFPDSRPAPALQESYPLLVPLHELEPELRAPHASVLFLRERSVDPRDLTAATIAAAHHRGVDFSSGNQVLSIEVEYGKAVGVRTNKTQFFSAIVVNCAGAWSGQIGVGAGDSPASARPTRPVKGQMLCVVMPRKEMIRHVIRTQDVYLIPRSDGRMLIGATQEEAGFDKQTVPATIQTLRQTALALVPKLADALILEDWAGLRPGTPDNLPILGATSIPGYFVATGHFRDGILLAPITARVMRQVIVGQKPEFDLKAFAADRFQG